MKRDPGVSQGIKSIKGQGNTGWKKVCDLSLLCSLSVMGN